MCKIFIISLLSLFINSFATAQSVVPSVIMGRDTVPHVLLHEVDVVARRIPENTPASNNGTKGWFIT